MIVSTTKLFHAPWINTAETKSKFYKWKFWCNQVQHCPKTVRGSRQEVNISKVMGGGTVFSLRQSAPPKNWFCEWASKAVGCEWRKDPPVLPCTGAASSQLLIPTPSRAVCNAAVLWACASPCPTLFCQCSSTAATLPLQHTRTDTQTRNPTVTYVSANSRYADFTGLIRNNTN